MTTTKKYQIETFVDGSIYIQFPTPQTQEQLDELLIKIANRTGNNIQATLSKDRTYEIKPVEGIGLVLARINPRRTVLVATAQYQGQTVQLIARSNETLQYEQLEARILSQSKTHEEQQQKRETFRNIK